MIIQKKFKPFRNALNVKKLVPKPNGFSDAFSLQEHPFFAQKIGTRL
jgi:hypothetical protein